VSTLSRYVASRFLRAFLGAFVILALSVLVVDMLLNLEDVLEAERSLSGALRFLALRLASVYLPYLLPVATFTGAFFAVGLLGGTFVPQIIGNLSVGATVQQSLLIVLAMAAALFVIAIFLGSGSRTAGKTTRA